MKKEVRTAVRDDELRVEAYRFEGIVQPFPNHFHEYYVIGFMEDGKRVLSCKDQEYTIAGGTFSCSIRATATPVYRVMVVRWTTGALISPKRSCWALWRRLTASRSYRSSLQT